MLRALDQLMVDRFEEDFLSSDLTIYDLSSCLAGYLKCMLVSGYVDFPDGEVKRQLVSLLGSAERKEWPATETPEKEKARKYFWFTVNLYKGVDDVLSSFARCCVFCANNDEDWADQLLGEDTPFLLYADELDRMRGGETKELVAYFRAALSLPAPM
ncbi:hypothetical protein P5705_03905 [Pseudomonas entomophila]|uniref:hypothetical protein n=1 Tax=Pseudomonas entomophila TaxID=312306 RepID=UPI002406FB84|nr:hypothetical protein [Pseudomonas entomophila]MDF9616777.1 hypothetical protein [Pseudomonas entomophila]